MAISTLSRLAGVIAATTLLHTTALADPVPATAKPEATKDVDDGLNWYRAVSDHFIAYSDQSKADTERRLKALEQFRFFATKLLPAAADDTPEPKLTIYLVANDQWLKLVDPRDAAGVYFACREGVSAFSAEEQSARFIKQLKLDPNLPKQDIGQTVLFHEYTHHLMFHSAAASYPLWYIEGLADYLSTFQFDGKTGDLGVAPYQDNWVLGQVSWGEFDRVLAPDGKLSSGLATREGADPAIFYAKAWLLTHYMMGDPERAKALAAYFAGLRTGADPVKSFKTATGIDPGGELTSRLRTYSRAMAYRHYLLPDMPDVKIDITPMPPTTNTYIIPAAALQTCLPPKAGEWMLKTLKEDADVAAMTKAEASEKNTDAKQSWERLKGQASDLAKQDPYRMAVAYGEILYGDPKAPLDALAAIAPSDALYPRAQYLQGRAWLALAGKAADGDKAADRARAVPFLEKAYTLSPDDGPTQFFLARAYEGRPDFPNDNAINAALGAVDALPSVYNYAAYAAWLELMRGDKADATSLLTPFAEDPHRRDHAKAVADIVAAIGQGKTAAEVKTMMDDLDTKSPR